MRFQLFGMLSNLVWYWFSNATDMCFGTCHADGRRQLESAQARWQLQHEEDSKGILLESFTLGWLNLILQVISSSSLFAAGRRRSTAPREQMRAAVCICQDVAATIYLTADCIATKACSWQPI
jgi:hypothetical protein